MLITVKNTALVRNNMKPILATVNDYFACNGRRI